QVLCVVLWSLDEYWYYSIFTLLLLIIFEATLCTQRQRCLELLRSMRREPSLVYARRAGCWTRVSSETLCPGEVVSLVARSPTVAAAMREAKRHAARGRGQRGRRQGGSATGVEGEGGGGVNFDPGLGAGMGVLSRGGKGMRGWDQGEGGGGAAEETLVHCDLLLLRGSVVVNEAMLTGESVPQAK
ncbi:unnamed protein product, partial [Discosporangium mesarthrocarpum]